VGSYGILGVSGFRAGNEDDTGILDLLTSTRAVFGGGDQQSFLVRNQPNWVRKFKWEEKKTANIGLDAGFLNNTITATLDLFRSKTEDVL
jgi:hypothetical protein